MSCNPLFKECVEKLLLGKVICETSSPDIFGFLVMNGNKKDVSDYIQRIGLDLSMTKDMKGYYGSIAEPSSGDKKSIRSRFDHVAKSLEGLVLLMRMLKSLSPRSRPINAMDVLKESTLIKAIEDAPSLEGQLNEVTLKLKIGKSGQSKAKVSALLKYLEQHEYLAPQDKNGLQYKATAKWSLLYDQLEFIQKNESIPLKEDTNQEELF